MLLQFVITVSIAILLFHPTEQQFLQTGDDGVVVFGLAFAALLASFLIPELKRPRLSCDENYVRYGEHCYLFVRDPLSWKEAKMSCNSDGGDLVSIETSDEASWINKEIEKLDEPKEIQISSDGTFNPVTYHLSLHGITFQNRDWISFYAKSCAQAAAVVLKEEQDGDAGYYAVTIGSRNNAYVEIYKGSPNANNRKAEVVVSNPLDCHYYSPYWVSVNDGHIQVGKGLEKGVGKVLEWQDSSHFDVKYVVLAGWNGPVDWIFHSGMAYWTSGSPNPVTSYYEWGSGESAQTGFTNWKSNEPSRTTDDMKCLALDTKWGNDGKWGDEICECRFAYICEKEANKSSSKLFSL